jgi:hypothetical protein
LSSMTALAFRAVLSQSIESMRRRHQASRARALQRVVDRGGGLKRRSGMTSCTMAMA